MAFITDTHGSASPFVAGFGVFATVKLWLNTMRERRALKRMSYSQLEDIGVSPKAADAEAARPFWDVSGR
ncbi:MAG: DUF1127 domain-containing protein [Pseudomonadota bacterium]